MAGALLGLRCQPRSYMNRTVELHAKVQVRTIGRRMRPSRMRDTAFAHETVHSLPPITGWMRFLSGYSAAQRSKVHQDTVQWITANTKTAERVHKLMVMSAGVTGERMSRRKHQRRETRLQFLDLKVVSSYGSDEDKKEKRNEPKPHRRGMPQGRRSTN